MTIPPQFLTIDQITSSKEEARGRRPGRLEDALKVSERWMEVELGGLRISEPYGENESLSAVFWARSLDEDAPLLCGRDEPFRNQSAGI